MFESLLQNGLRMFLLAALLAMDVARGVDAVRAQSVAIAVVETNPVSAPPPQKQLLGSPPVAAPTSEVVVVAPPSPAAPSQAENQEQRRLLLGLMLVLIGIAVWRLFRRRR
jgi:hypothetical protein